MNKNLYINNFEIWEQSETEQLPDISFIPPLTRRRLTKIEKIGIYLANKVCGDKNDYFTIFASRFGEWNITFELIKQLHLTAEISPAGFSTSVHNATPGILSVLTKNQHSYTAISAKEWTIDNALTEASISKLPVLLIYVEEETPEFYKEKFQTPFLSHGIALLISDKKEGQPIEISNSFSKDKFTTFTELKNFLINDTNLQTNHLLLRKLK